MLSRELPKSFLPDRSRESHEDDPEGALYIEGAITLAVACGGLDGFAVT